MADSCAECCCCCAICFACCSLCERVCFWIPLPERFQRKKNKDMDDDGFFPQQNQREAELFHARADVTSQEPTPMAPMYNPRQPPVGPPPGHTALPSPDVNNGNASRKAFLDELHEDRSRPAHRSARSTGQYHSPGNGNQYSPDNTGSPPPANTLTSNSSPPQPGFHNHTPTPRDA